jgi:hypothetical protein
MPDVRQTITDFYRVAQDRDFARDFQFRVLNIQAGDTSNVTFDEDDLVYIRTATLPGKAITNQNVPYMGLQFRVPGNVTYNMSEGWSVQFYCDQNSKIRQTLENYQRDIFDDATSTGNYNAPKPASLIDLVQLDTQLEEVAHYQLVGAYPTTVGDIGYTIAEGSGATLTVDATFAFQYWRRLSP